jgi:hypothetical protein
LSIQGNIIAGACNGLFCNTGEFNFAILGNSFCNNVLFYFAINTADLIIVKKDKKRQERKVLTGCYVIETTHSDMDAADILKAYHSLSRVEAAFGSLKTDLGLRPVYHHKEERCRAHLFISVLAYHLLNTIEIALKDKGCNRKWSTIRDELSTHMRTTVIMSDSEGGIHHIRLSSTPETNHQQIYDMLGIKDNLGKIHLKF